MTDCEGKTGSDSEVSTCLWLETAPILEEIDLFRVAHISKFPPERIGTAIKNHGELKQQRLSKKIGSRQTVLIAELNKLFKLSEVIELLSRYRAVADGAMEKPWQLLDPVLEDLFIWRICCWCRALEKPATVSIPTPASAPKHQHVRN